MHLYFSLSFGLGWYTASSFLTPLYGGVPFKSFSWSLHQTGVFVLLFVFVFVIVFWLKEFGERGGMPSKSVGVLPKVVYTNQQFSPHTRPDVPLRLIDRITGGTRSDFIFILGGWLDFEILKCSHFHTFILSLPDIPSMLVQVNL